MATTKERVDKLEKLMAELIKTQQRTELELQRLSKEMREFKDEMRTEMKEFKEAIRKDTEEFKEAINRDTEKFKEAIKKDTENFKETMRKEMQEFKEAINRDTEKFKEAIKKDTENFKEAMRKEMQEFKEAINRDTEKFKEAIKKDTENFKEAMRKEMQEFKEAINKDTEKFKEAIKKDTDELKKSMNKRWGELANKLGTIVEDIIVPAVSPVVKQYFNCEIDDLQVNRKKKDKKTGLKDEFDVIAVSDDCKTVFLVEVKSTPKIDYINEFKDRKIDRFLALFPEYREYKLIPIFASLRLEEDIINYLTKQKMYAMAYKEWEYMDILNFDKINQLN
ncbi:hypothetical protein JCM14244_07390 [Venenivibrio stagnispumantis]|uniref:Apolipoprotein A1/A4/E domain-containing protein n=1 Tax=Venenivibrio stagnispumantis TaxID=407998 RepID=A0AA46ACX4_9AQUI|nr:apolipoprotein A1/A4/E family protein [Venenivibrio stagnispumantis]MCW4573930.1 apolipoprotein A1/A4/E family protein [Venenivibrio stagnispumantis]SMP01110.1 Apolipoprotein A1/A4/E domain-containing protein [Venenivibrio stagnispumantis]